MDSVRGRKEQTETNFRRYRLTQQIAFLFLRGIPMDVHAADSPSLIGTLPQGKQAQLVRTDAVPPSQGQADVTPAQGKSFLLTRGEQT